MRVALYFVRFHEVEIEVGWQVHDTWPTKPQLQAGLAGIAHTLFNPAGTLLQESRTLKETVALGKLRFGYKVEFPEGLAIGSGRSPWVSLKGSVWLEAMPLARPVVRSYVGLGPQAANAVVESFGLGATAVIHAGDAKIGCIVDLTDIHLPPLSQFRYAAFESEEENNYASFEIIGTEKLLNLGHVKLTVVRA